MPLKATPPLPPLKGGMSWYRFSELGTDLKSSMVGGIKIVKPPFERARIAKSPLGKVTDFKVPL